jgi:hypothetical protein
VARARTLLDYPLKEPNVWTDIIYPFGRKTAVVLFGCDISYNVYGLGSCAC